MPDAALQRLRRAQHPGHRRQAHPAHPQRDEHRLRGRRVGPRDGPPEHLVQHRGRPRLPRGPPAWSRGDAGRALHVVRSLQHLQRAGGDQDGQVPGPRARRRRHHRRDRRASDVRQRARHGTREAVPGGFDEVAAGEIFGREHLGGVATDNLLELTRADRERIFNLGYFTWVEQQGLSVEEFRCEEGGALLGTDPPDRGGLGRDDRASSTPAPAFASQL